MTSKELRLDRVPEKYRTMVIFLYSLGDCIPGVEVCTEALKGSVELTFEPTYTEKKRREVCRMQCKEVDCISVAFEHKEGGAKQHNFDGGNKWTLPEIKNKLAVWGIWLDLDLEVIAGRKMIFRILLSFIGAAKEGRVIPLNVKEIAKS